MNLIIRELKRTEIAELSRLATDTYVESFAQLYSAEEMKKMIEDFRSVRYFESVFGKDVILLALINDEIVGYVQFGAVSTAFPNATPADCELGRLYVKRAYQNQGIGKGLLEAAFNHPLLKQAVHIYLDVWDENKIAQKLYENILSKLSAQFPTTGTAGLFQTIL